MLAVFLRNGWTLERIDGFAHKVSTDSRTFYFVGSIDGLVQDDYTASDGIDMQNAVSDLYSSLPRFNGNYAGVSIRDGVLELAATDIGAVEELYYTLTETELIVSNDFFSLAQAKGELDYDTSEVRHFFKSGLCHNGKTTFSKVYRLSPGKALWLDNKGTISTHNYLNNFDGIPVSFDVFKNAIKNSIHSIIQNDPMCEEVVMFSGGVDSSILLSLVRDVKDVKAITYRYIPTISVNELDVIKSARIAKKLHVTQEFIDVDLNEINLEYLDDVVVSMPFAPHLGVNYKKIFEQLHNRRERLWCGQNMDTLYNYIETAASAKSIINRFMLSDAYGRMLNGVNGHEKYGLAKKAFDFSLRSFCQTVYKQRIETPNTIEELVYYHNESYTDAVQVTGKQNESYTCSPETSETIAVSDIRKRLFEEELGGFFTGGDHKIQLQAKKLFNVENVLLYSMPNMVHVLRNINLSWPDVLFPKRFAYRYARELGLRKSDFNAWRSYIASLRRPRSGNKSIELIDSTSLGAELHKKSKNSPIKKLLIPDTTSKYQWLRELKIFWISKIHEKLCQLGVVPR